ncbi:NACHT, LRR and PYD domains-containing protein 10 [Tupaia chinensis]|uniref:NACHT, LRR and PYD domains-containing protein 10 n=1 Tax=Tupaia chinensis TaxID=246437 RepID=L8YAR9_TUPCH|nr:NACHT, LRR and PYD domains-containing protein 10 [Tupaia chinensis]ELV13367.1 NACHT, LRR and PYD domains-containing protein 10 [Tupaia chinensis]
MALARSPREALLWALNDLDENSFKTLKFYLLDHARSMSGNQRLLTRGELENLGQVDLASRLILKYGAQEAVKVVCQVLEAMNLLELVNQLSHICLNDYRAIYREHVLNSEERREGDVGSSYSQLLLVAKLHSGSPGSSACSIPEQEELDSVMVDALFGPDPSLVVLQGAAGTGKTTLARKILLDWASGTLYADRFDYVFHVSCRDVVLLLWNQLDKLLCWCCGDNQAPVAEIQREAERLLFILDGFDELQRPFANQLVKRSSSRMEDVLRLLIRRQKLPKCSLLITTRSLALQNLEPLLKEPLHIHILGFSEEERESYFSSYFADKEQARKAFEFVQGNNVLFKACQFPSICWMVCSWLKEQKERDKATSETPSNSTDIFMAYVTTFLPPNDSGDCSELSRHKILRGLCSLAVEGVQCQRLVFEEADLKKHNLDGPSLTAFLSSYDNPAGLDIKKFYSFRHITFQEFFYAMSYLVKEDQSQLGEASRKEVERLLKVEKENKSEAMTLTVQFLLDLLQKENSLNFQLKFCFNISPSLKQDLRRFKEQIEAIKHKRPWDLEFSLYKSKMKSMLGGIEMSDVLFKVGHSNEIKPHSKCSVSVKASLGTGQEKEQQCPLVGKRKRVKALNGANGKDRQVEELDKEVGSNGMEAEKWEQAQAQGEKDGQVKDQENGEKRK